MRAEAPCAVFEALESALTAYELGSALAGGGPTELVPPRSGEDPAEYGCRAACEIMARYIDDGISEGRVEAFLQPTCGKKMP